MVSKVHLNEPVNLVVHGVQTGTDGEKNESFSLRYDDQSEGLTARQSVQKEVIIADDGSTSLVDEVERPLAAQRAES